MKRLYTPLLTAGMVLLALAFPPAPGHAGEAVESTSGGEDEAVAAALRHSHKLARLEAEVKAEEELLGVAAFAVDNPELRLEDISTQYADSGENKKLGIGLRWRPPRLGQLGEEQQERRVTLWEKKRDAQRFRLELASRVRLVHATCATLGQSMELVRRQAELAKATFEVVSSLVALGQRRLPDQVKARQRMVKANQEHRAVERRLAQARKKLAILTGVREEFPVDEATDGPVVVADFDTLLKRALYRRADVELDRQRTALAQNRSRAETLRMVPWFSFVELAYHHESQKDDWGELLVGFELPFFNWNGARYRAAKIRRGNGQDNADSARQVVEQELSKALGQYQETLEQWQSLKADIDDLLPASARLREEARKNQLPADEIQALEASDMELEQTLLDARLEVAEALADLCIAAGVEDPADLTP